MSRFSYPLYFVDVLRIAYVLWVAFILWLHVQPFSGQIRQRFWDSAFLAPSVLMIWCRRFPFFSFDRIINPDEALFAANALQSRFGWVNWGTIDPTTSGPLNSIVLTWPYLFGGDITLYSGRVTAALLACGTVGLLYATSRKIASFFWSCIAVMPCILVYATAAHFDFIHFSSEHLPVFLIALCAFLLVSAVKESSFVYCLLASFTGGLLPFAKLQASLFMALFGLAALAATCLSRAQSSPLVMRLGAILAAGAVPAMLFLVPAAMSGQLEDVANSYVIQQQLRRSIQIGRSLLTVVDDVPTFRRFLQTGVLLGLASALVIVVYRRTRAQLTKLQLFFLILSLVMLPVSYATVMIPERAFPHYFLFCLPAVTLAVIALASIADMRSSGLLPFPAMGLIYALSVCPVFFTAMTQVSFSTYFSRPPFATGAPFTSPRPLSWLGVTSSDRFICWGWRAECYVDAALRSGTRDATSENQLYRTALLPYFRSRFMADFEKTRPDFVIDFVAPGSFGFTAAQSHGIAAFPEFMSAIRSDFQLVSQVSPPDRCPRLYVRNVRLDSIKKSLVEFADTSGPAEDGHGPDAVDDRSIFETCDDFWLLPKQTLGTLSIVFRKPSRVRRVAILNTRNKDFGDRGTERLRIRLFDQDRLVAEREILPQRYPHWTTFELEQPIERASSLKIDILSYLGDGGGLNEVKVYSE